MENNFTTEEKEFLKTLFIGECERLQRKIRVSDFSEKSEFKTLKEIEKSLILLQTIKEKINQK